MNHATLSFHYRNGEHGEDVKVEFILPWDCGFDEIVTVFNKVLCLMGFGGEVEQKFDTESTNGG